MGCGDQPQQQTLSATEQVAKEPLPTAAKNNYAVIWKWSTDDVKLVQENTPMISSELMKLWNDKIVENLYYDGKSPVNKLANFPNISFFIKASSAHDASKILDQLTIVKKGFAAYQLYPVGHLWLDRKTDVINKNGITESFVTIWTNVSNNAPTEDLKVEQNDAILELWNAGTIENVYFDVEGVENANNKSDFVLFINAQNEEEARDICNALPFPVASMATYKLHQAGMFWMGRQEK